MSDLLRLIWCVGIGRFRTSVSAHVLRRECPKRMTVLLKFETRTIRAKFSALCRKFPCSIALGVLLQGTEFSGRLGEGIGSGGANAKFTCSFLC
jgi:hypothetical protein